MTQEDKDFLWSLMPEWVKEVPDDTHSWDPMWYGTLSRKGDLDVNQKVKKLLTPSEKNYMVISRWVEEGKEEWDVVPPIDTPLSYDEAVIVKNIVTEEWKKNISKEDWEGFHKGEEIITVKEFNGLLENEKHDNS